MRVNSYSPSRVPMSPPNMYRVPSPGPPTAFDGAYDVPPERCNSYGQRNSRSRSFDRNDLLRPRHPSFDDVPSRVRSLEVMGAGPRRPDVDPLSSALGLVEDDCLLCSRGRTVHPASISRGHSPPPGRVNYVGAGSRAFSEEPRFAYQGFGADWPARRKDFSLIGGLLALVCVGIAILPVVYTLMSGFHKTHQWNCSDGYAEWRMQWSATKKAYCCETLGRGCAEFTEFTKSSTTLQQSTSAPSMAPAPAVASAVAPAVLPAVAAAMVPAAAPSPAVAPTEEAAAALAPAEAQTLVAEPSPAPAVQKQPQASANPPDPFNCEIDKDLWETAWGDDKKEWCCQVHHFGCPVTTPAPQPMAQPAMQPAAQPIAQPVAQPQAPVATRPLVATQPPTAPPTTSTLYDCGAGFKNWIAGWSIPKKAWCCGNSGKGCEPGIDVKPLSAVQPR